MFCSLISKIPQSIPPNEYVALRFEEESTDPNNWHPTTNPDDPRSALIVPRLTAVGLVSALVFWGSSDATQMLHRFTRHPYDPALIDSTCTNDRAPTPGQEFHTFSWPMTVRTDQPLALMVSHNASAPVTVNLAEFKVWVP